VCDFFHCLGFVHGRLEHSVHVPHDDGSGSLLLQKLARRIIRVFFRPDATVRYLRPKCRDISFDPSLLHILFCATTAHHKTTRIATSVPGAVGLLHWQSVRTRFGYYLQSVFLKRQTTLASAMIPCSRDQYYCHSLWKINCFVAVVVSQHCSIPVHNYYWFVKGGRA
jgi:hypothetical protein